MALSQSIDVKNSDDKSEADEKTKLKKRAKILKEWINAKTSTLDCLSALHYAAFHDNITLMRLLVQHGANL